MEIQQLKIYLTHHKLSKNKILYIQIYKIEIKILSKKRKQYLIEFNKWIKPNKKEEILNGVIVHNNYLINLMKKQKMKYL